MQNIMTLFRDKHRKERDRALERETGRDENGQLLTVAAAKSRPDTTGVQTD